MCSNIKKKLYGPFLLWMRFNCLKATATSRRQFTFYHSVLRNSWYSFYRPRKDERLSRPWSHPVVLITGPLDWESSALTTRPLLVKSPHVAHDHQKWLHMDLIHMFKMLVDFFLAAFHNFLQMFLQTCEMSN